MRPANKRGEHGKGGTGEGGGGKGYTGVRRPAATAALRRPLLPSLSPPHPSLLHVSVPAPPPFRRWSCLSAAGMAQPSRVYIATNASYYKHFEFWALGKGVALQHVINSGRSVGDAR